MRNVLLLNLTATVLILAAGALAKSGTALAQPGLGLPVPQGTPAALIKKIVVSGEVRTETELSQATLTRGGTTVRIVLPTILYIDDVIETFPGTQVTVLFFNSPVPDHDNEVIIDAESKVGISSSDSWWGRVWVKVKDTFTSETRYARLSAKGTEYEFKVCPRGKLTFLCTGEERSALVVLEGQIEVEKGTYRLAGETASLAPEVLRSGESYPRFRFASFALEAPGQVQASRPLDVKAGTKEEFDITYNIFNECRQPHRFEFRTSDSTEWLQLEVQRRMTIAARQRLAVNANLKIDATQLAPDQYVAHVYVLCLDCNLEPGCSQAQLDWPYRLNTGVGRATPTPTPTVTPTPRVTPTPTVTPTPPNQIFTVNELQESVITKGFDVAAPAPDARVLPVLDWTNNVLLITQPSYSNQNIIPHFSTIEQRSQSFRDARPRAILRHEPDSNRILGDVYLDWGQAALAVFAYEKEVRQRLLGNSLIDQGEAYRITGQLGRARQSAGTDAGSPRALNLLGNIALDEGRIALDQGNKSQAKANLEQARKAYEDALKVPTGPPSISVTGSTTIQTNLAEAHIAAGDIAVKENATQEAKDKYSRARQALESVQQAGSVYPFGVTDLGRAYQGTGDVAALEGNVSEAKTAYNRAIILHNQATTAHKDFAEAYFNLGDLYDDLGDTERAKANYRLAIQKRPEQPASYYPLAVLLQDEDPQLAKALAATYLQLERPDLKHGEKASNAQRIVRGGDKVIVPDRPGKQVSNLKTVPDILNKTSAEAVSAARSAGFIPNITSRPDSQPKDLVIGQNPAPRTEARPDSTIEIIVSAGPDGTVLVPDVLNKSEAEAKAAIEGVRLRVQIGGRRNDPKAVGTVLEQRPTGGSSAARDSAVEIIVSLGITEPPVVPDVLNMSLTDATTAIENAGLKVRRIQTRRENKPKNTVVQQSPNAGRTVRPGSNVDLVVSEGVDVPGVINNSRDRATREIVRRGLTVGKIEERGSCKVGDVIAQSPEPHAKADPGTPVDLVIGSLGENPVSVPNFIRRSRDEAIAAMRDQNLTLGRVGTEESDAPEGTVIKQSPRAETQFARNCPFKIDLTVAIPLTVPDVRGLSERVARFQISLKGFSASVEYRETSDQRDGIVLEQDPQPRTPAARGTVVKLVVSKVPTVPVPSVVTMLLPNAKATLENAQLNLGQVTYEKSNASPAPVGRTFGFPADTCKVTRQDPVGGRQVPRGTAVHLWVIEWLDGNHKQLDCRNYSNVGN